MNFMHEGLWPDGSASSFWKGVGTLWIFSAAVSAMDPPQAGGSKFYGWLYRFTHLLAANLDRVLKISAPTRSEIEIQNKEKA